ncbi:MAG: hypothetical protein H6606_06020 [Flavobacteriales bacterium]|nr:hypothetical protein [Flavobacteriales bacterium]
MAQVLKQLFSKEIQKNLYPNHSPFKHARLDIGISADVENVEVPQAGSMPAIVENPSSFPLTIVERTDDKKSYAVDLLAAPPVRVREHDNVRLTYKKNKDVLEDQRAQLQERIGDKMAYVWSPTLATNIVRTSGADAPVLLSGATGTRKKLTLDNLIELARIMDNMEVPEEGRVLLMSGNMYAELVQAGFSSFVGSDKLSKDLIEAGVVAKVLNFNVYKRSKTCRFDNAGTPVKKVYTAAAAATDNDSCLAWHPRFVRCAEGIVDIFYNEKRAEHLGDIMSAQVRAGGMIGRSDEKGVVSLVQAHGA